MAETEGPEAMPVVIETHGPIRVLRINRPHAGNSITPEVYAGLGEAFVTAEQDDAVRVLIVTGTGDRIFCAGMDLRGFAQGRRMDPDRPGLEVIHRRFYPKPIVAAVNGVAVAGGFELALACDVVICAEHARFGIPEVKRGLVAVNAAPQLSRRISRAVALEMALTGDMIDAQRAYELGLVNRVVPAGAVMDEAFAMAERIMANGPLALQIAKRLTYEAYPPVDWTRVSALNAVASESEDAREGARAFVEKRAPQWRGR